MRMHFSAEIEPFLSSIFFKQHATTNVSQLILYT